MALDLTRFLCLIEAVPEYDQLRRGRGQRLVLTDAAKPYLIAALYRHWRRPVLVMTAQPERGKKLYEQIAVWAGAGAMAFPEPELEKI